MNQQQQQQPAQTKLADVEPKYAPLTRLAVVYFRDSVMFGSEMQSASVSKSGGNVVDIIIPGLLDDSGAILTGSDGAQGLVLRKKIHNLHTGVRQLAQTFVPWSNIKSIGYGPQE